jgi:hypothetical protein
MRKTKKGESKKVRTEKGVSNIFPPYKHSMQKHFGAFAEKIILINALR